MRYIWTYCALGGESSTREYIRSTIRVLCTQRQRHIRDVRRIPAALDSHAASSIFPHFVIAAHVGWFPTMELLANYVIVVWRPPQTMCTVKCVLRDSIPDLVCVNHAQEVLKLQLTELGVNLGKCSYILTVSI